MAFDSSENSLNDDSTSDIEWPSIIGNAEQVDSSLEEKLEVVDDTSLWPSISPEQTIIEAMAASADHLDIPDFVGEDHEQQINADQAPEFVSSAQPSEDVQPSEFDSEKESQSDQINLGQGESFVIPDLNLWQRKEMQDQPNDEIYLAEGKDLSDSQQDLGELRFAADD